MRAITALALGGVLALAACSTATAPSQSALLIPSAPAGASPSPSTRSSAEPTPIPSLAAVPSPTVEPTPSPATLNVTTADGERMLVAGVRQDLLDVCEPISAAMPRSAVAGIRCRPASKVVDRVTLYLFLSQKDLLDAYDAWLAAHKIPRITNGGRCLVGRPSEGGYVPGDGHEGIVVVERGGCYVDASRKAHYAATLPPFVLAEVDGKVEDSQAVEGWAWRGNKDQPGAPTIWFSTDQ